MKTTTLLLSFSVLRACQRILSLAAIMLLCFSYVPPLSAEEPSAQKDLMVFLVRHAEKVSAKDDPDPDLTVAGRLRAAQLAVLLRDSGVDHVHSSDYKRTRNTASPTATELGLEVEPYDPRDLDGLVKTLRGTGGRHLIVGHSNTIPKSVELLGGQSGSPIDETSEFDRLYIVSATNGAVSSAMLRYGAPFIGGPGK